MSAFWIVLLLLMVLAVMVVPSFLPRRKQRDGVPGMLLVTGVSPRPDASGEQYVTIAGVITGPTLEEHSVYRRLVIDVGNWPSIGELRPVVYSPRNPDEWYLTQPEEN